MKIKTIKIAPATIKIYVRAYEPFRAGAHPYRFKLTKMPRPEVKYQFAKGIEVYFIKGPPGKSIVVEVTSGGVVGNTLEEVQKDFKNAPPQVTREQIAKHIKFFKNESMHTDPVSNEEFWDKHVK